MKIYPKHYVQSEYDFMVNVDNSFERLSQNTWYSQFEWAFLRHDNKNFLN